MLLTTIFFWYLLVLCASLVGALTSDGRRGKRYYKNLDLPQIAPESWVFGIVWPILYVLQASACWLLQDNNASNAWSFELTLYVIFLGVSTLFSPVFFKLRSNLVAFVIMILSVGLGITVNYFFFANYLLSGWLFLPTNIWIVFATYLMLCIWINNRSDTYTKKELSAIVATSSKDHFHHHHHHEIRRNVVERDTI